MINPYLPQPASLRCRQIIIDPEAVTIMVETMTPAAACPVCGRQSGRIHSQYARSLADLPWQGQIVRWCLRVRKFFCDMPTCTRRIFTERLPDVATPYARKTARLNKALTCIAFACGGEGGSCLAGRLGMPTSPDTLLRRIRRASPPVSSSLHAVGVDDWALRRGQRYGTLLCDLERHCPVDVLNGREAKTLATWLQQHPGIQVITRDRASCYSQGASTGAPQAIQVADRFHLMQNLRQALIRLLEHRYRETRLAARDVAAVRQTCDTDSNVVEPPKRPREHRLPRGPTLREVRRARRLQRYDQVIELHHQGVSQRTIAKRLGINRETVGRYIRAGQFPERTPRKYASKTGPFTDYLRKRWAEGCHNAVQLAQELRAQGFRGSYHSVRRRVAHWRCTASEGLSGRPSPVPPAVHPPSARRLAGLLLKVPGELDDQDRIFVDALFQRCPEVADAAPLARDFATMLRQLQGNRLDTWIQRAWDRSIPRELRTFATGLKSDYEAVKAALTTRWSNAQLEGQVNRLKLIKRQMYGRAKLDLLRQRVLHAG
ncbi:MAG: ISL3 family transposase [Phycisphaerales bacterium]|nr:MAG: ISL3 family transposase [Phycisphaerales bacterium]